MRSVACSLVVALVVLCAAPCVTRAVTVQLVVAEAGSTAPLPCRVHVMDAAGKPVLPTEYPAFRTHFVCDGRARLSLAPGDYTVEIERGPEYTAASVTWRIAADAEAAFRYELKRIANLAREGWWSGELHVHRPPRDIELLMRAEDLHMAPVITWWKGRNRWGTEPVTRPFLVHFDDDRYYRLMGGEDERAGGALLYFGLEEPLPIADEQQEYRSPMVFLEQARAQGAWIDVEKPFWYDVPVWLASGKVDSIGLANNHLYREGGMHNEAWGRARDAEKFPGPHGSGLWSQTIYQHILNAGLRIPPSAGSASGVLPNPVGYNRVYVHFEGAMNYDAWWEALRAGRSFVTNGPLLRVNANGQWPGHVFRITKGQSLELAFEVQLDSRDEIDRIELIRNGEVIKTISGHEWRGQHRLGPIRTTESGWCLVRVIAAVPQTFRFASTAPFYIEVDGAPVRISRKSAQFFLDWVRERMERIKIDDPQQKAEVMSYHLAAEKFWADKLSAANAP